jgi:hypothetical protein
MKDLQSPTLIKIKALLFLFLGIASATMLLAWAPYVQVLVLLCLVIWSFCRFYYFAFYVIHTYLDTSFKYSGLLSLLKYFFAKKSFKKISPPATLHP